MSVESAIYGKLHSASDLVALLGLPPLGFGFSIYHLQAPQDAKFPYIVFNQQAATPEAEGMTKKADGTGPLENELWLIKAIDRQAAVSLDLTRAEKIAKRIDSLLKDDGLGYLPDPPIGQPAFRAGFAAAVTATELPRTQRYFRREREMPTYAEREEDQFYVHAGSVFRLVYQ